MNMFSTVAARVLGMALMAASATVVPVTAVFAQVANDSVAVEGEAALPVSPAAVWREIGGFGSFGSWFPGATGTTLSADGRTRVTTMADGATVTERLTASDAAARSYSYELVAGRLPARVYRATIAVAPNTGGGALVRWTATGAPAAGTTADALKMRIERIVETGLSGIRQRFAAQGANAAAMPGHRVVDLSHEVKGAIPIFPGARPFAMHRGANYEQGYRTDWFEFGDSSTGTNMDAPLHFVPNGITIGDIPAGRLVLPLVVIDIHEAARRDPNAGVGAAELAAWERLHGRIPAGAFIAIYAGWADRFADPQRFLSAAGPGKLGFPGFKEDAATFLMERGVAGAGVEAISADVGSSATFGFHRAMLGAGKILVEELTNLDQVPATGATIVIGVLPIEGAAQAPARVLAFVPAP